MSEVLDNAQARARKELEEAKKMQDRSGWYIHGKGDAGWMGAIDGPFKTEEEAIAKAQKWIQPSWEEDQLEVAYSEEGEDV